MTSGGMEPCTPSEVPTSQRVAGMRRMSRIRNGTERRMFTTNDSVV
jgi:hypothetical protein